MSSGAFVIERFVREQLRDSTDEYARRRYRQIPLYQELLAEVSQRYTPHPDNPDRLINAALALESVVFITLNYDTILDSRLALQTGPIMSMDDYVRDDQKWALVKLHGSVNWARIVSDPDLSEVDARMLRPFDKLGDGLEQALDPEIHLRHMTDMQMWRLDNTTPRLYFPALSVPLGAEDELVCPPNHVDFLRQRLEGSDGLNLLVIGYSGVDQEVLTLLAESKNSVRYVGQAGSAKPTTRKTSPIAALPTNPALACMRAITTHGDSVLTVSRSSRRRQSRSRAAGVAMQDLTRAPPQVTAP